MLGPLTCVSRRRHLSPKPGDLVLFPKAHVNVEEGNRLHNVVFWSLHIPQYLWFPRPVLHTSNTAASMTYRVESFVNHTKPVGQTFITYFVYIICVFVTTCLWVHVWVTAHAQVYTWMKRQRWTSCVVSEDVILLAVSVTWPLQWPMIAD